MDETPSTLPNNMYPGSVGADLLWCLAGNPFLIPKYTYLFPLSVPVFIRNELIKEKGTEELQTTLSEKDKKEEGKVWEDTVRGNGFDRGQHA